MTGRLGVEQAATHPGPAARLRTATVSRPGPYHDGYVSTPRCGNGAVRGEHPDSICHTAHIGHRWIDNIAISDTVDGIISMLRVY
ncbi:hypothetical protein [Streptomyces sp. NPDC001401]|uniref:hypothetical protein n=1 Tax=Streptomyces sp. NPDC001401 TaxID=3364570 RepID=UPI003699A389